MKQRRRTFPYDTGVYAIVNIVNGKRYIGSAVCLMGRRTDHFSTLRAGVHKNDHLQKAWAKYGEGVFIFEVLLYCDRENTLFYEQRAIDAFGRGDKRNNLYNINPMASSRLGRPLTAEEKAHLSKVKKGRISPRQLDALMKRNKASRGRKLSDETRAKMRAVWTPEYREAARQRNLGKKMLPHVLEKQRLRMMGNTNTLGYKHSDESKLKMYEARVKRYGGYVSKNS